MPLYSLTGFVTIIALLPHIIALVRYLGLESGLAISAICFMLLFASGGAGAGVLFWHLVSTSMLNYSTVELPFHE